MRIERSVTDRAVDAVCARVEAELAGRGWVRRPGGLLSSAVFTSARPDGLLAIISVSRPVFSWPARWPERLRLECGVGYEPALDLAPLLALPAVSLLAKDVDAVELTGEAAIGATAERIVGLCEQQALGLRDSFADLTALETVLDEVHPRLLLLLATGRRNEARTLLDDYAQDPENSHDRRFVRQVRRRLDDDALPVPPFDVTMLQLPRPRFETPSWSTTRATSLAEQDALSAVRVQRRGKTPDELARLVVEEMRRRGVELSEIAVELDVALLRLEQRPFGRVTSTVKALGLVGSAISSFAKTVRGTAPRIPDWLRPPNTELYRLPNAAGESGLPVVIDRAARPFIARILDRDDGPSGTCGPAGRPTCEAPRVMPGMVLLEASVTADETGIVVVGLGTQRVGILSAENSLLFQPYLSAARIFDEQAIVSATILRARGRYIIEIRRPAPVEA